MGDAVGGIGLAGAPTPLARATVADDEDRPPGTAGPRRRPVRTDQGSWGTCGATRHSATVTTRAAGTGAAPSTVRATPVRSRTSLMA